jgi:hypothetical protein
MIHVRFVVATEVTVRVLSAGMLYSVVQYIRTDVAEESSVPKAVPFSHSRLILLP